MPLALEWCQSGLGDAMSDKDLFEVVPVSIAVNTNGDLAGRATHSCIGRDLWDAYELVWCAR